MAGKGPSPAQVYAAALERVSRLTALHASLGDLVEARAAEAGERPALVSRGERMTYAGLADRSRRYARWARDAGLSRGGRLGLLMRGRPEYLAAWIGLTRVGVRVALLNPELEPPGLAHAVSVADAGRILVDPGLLSRAEGARTLSGRPFEITVLGGDAGPRVLDRLDPATVSGAPLEAAGDRPELHEEALQIFTSGTTGLPKAARVSHRRILTWSGWFSGMMGLESGDRLYDCLPLHHSVGGVASLGAVLASGASAALRDRFSASAFWSDLEEFECTAFQYIGEICRYLLAAPGEAPSDHKIRLACGNGLGGDIWAAFQNRFALPRILEFYASTEGNFSLFNVEGRTGSVGRIPGFLAHRMPVALIEVAPQTSEPTRLPGGLCRRVERGAAGEAVAPISPSGAGAFEGYTDPEASRRKILRDVFAPGDAWYRSGDLMRQDEAGFFYFLDRLGETYRWKGENVSTSEVQAALLACPGVREALVFGVKIGPLDGRAGMAVLAGGEDLDLERVRHALSERLPVFARPLVWRITGALSHTPTMRPQRAPYVEVGFDPARTRDPLFLVRPGAETLTPIDAGLYAALMAGEVRL